MAHLAVPIDIVDLQKQLHMAHTIASQLLTISKVLGVDSLGGLYVQSLSHTADISYESLNNKYNTIVFYYTRKSKYDSDKIFKNLEARRKPVNKLLPNPDKQPRMLQPYMNNLPNFNTRRSMPAPDDSQGAKDNTTETHESNQAETEVSSDEDEDVTDNPDVQVTTPVTTTTTPSANLTTNTPAPGTLKFGKLYGKAAADPENFDSPYEQNILEAEDDDEDRRKRSAPIINDIDSSQEVGLLKRTKRFIASLVFSLLASIGVSSIFGAVTASQMSTLKSGVSDLNLRQNLIIHQLEKGSKAILANRNLINNLEDLSIKLSKFVKVEHFEANGMLLYIIMTAEYARIDEALNAFIQIVEAATNHQFHPAILSQHGGIAAFEQIQAIAESRGLSPVINNAQQMSQLRTHFYFTPTGINLVIEIPLCGEHNTFVLYQFQALPIQLSPEVFITLVPKYPLIGIGEPDLNSHAKYLELDHTDLSRCQKLGQVFLCKDQTIINRPNPDSCLYALYISDHRAAQQNCRVNLKGNKKDHAVAVSHDTYAYYSATPTTYNIVCQNQTISSSGHQLTGISKLKVPKFCRIETARFVLYPENELFREVHPKRFKWTLPVLSFLKNDTTITDINSAVKALEQAKGTPAIDPEFIQEFKRRAQPFYNNHFPFTAFVLASLGLVIILTLIGIVVFKNYMARRAAKNLSDPSYRWKELVKDQTKFDEYLEHLVSRRSST